MAVAANRMIVAGIDFPAQVFAKLAFKDIRRGTVVKLKRYAAQMAQGVWRKIISVLPPVRNSLIAPPRSLVISSIISALSHLQS